MDVMNKTELHDWIEKAELIECDSDYDDCGNENRFDIYKFEGKLYKVESCNYHITPIWDKSKGWLYGKYMPIEVKKKVEMVEEVTWEEVKH